MVNRRRAVEAVTAVVLGAVAVIAILSGTTGFLPRAQAHPFIPAANAIGVPANSLPPGASTTPGTRITSIPVISWHQMDNGCQPTEPRCTAADYGMTNVTQRQFYDELSWLHSRGYRTVTAEQYVKWAAGQPVLLPEKPVLLTVDDGIANFYAGATPVLRHFGDTMVSTVVSGFAQAAQDGESAYKGWDASWTQLRNLPEHTWEFAFHAGPLGHAATNASCPYFYPCQRAGESAAVYQKRVKADIDQGVAAAERELGNRVTTTMWAVPFNDLAQAPGEPQSGAEPARWLQEYAGKRFAVVFVDGLNTRAGQHYRYEVHGPDTLAFFAGQVERAGLYTRLPSPATASARAGGQS